MLAISLLTLLACDPSKPAPDRVDTGEPCTSQLWYADADQDRYGDASETVEACEAPEGYVAIDGDCDDANADVRPGLYDDCDDVDKDCDGLVDEDEPPVTGYPDADGDGYGDGSASEGTGCASTLARVEDNTDCDDADAAINPGAVDDCEAEDLDCDGIAEEYPEVRVWYADGDGDSYGVDGDTVEAECAPSGYASLGGDCDDTDAEYHPGAGDGCDAEDWDCDGVAEESRHTTTWYPDADGDGYGVDTGAVDAGCPPDGYASASGDCDESNVAVNPGEVEICGGLDDDCDGLVDEDDDSLTGATIWYTDADGDGYGDLSTREWSCTSAAPAGSADNPDDLNDSDADGGVAIGADDADDVLDARDASLNGLGAFLTVTDDLSGDGLPELLTGATESIVLDYGESHGFFYGSTYLWEGPGGASSAARLLAYDALYLGIDAAWIGDADGDGLSDLAIGAPLEWEFYSWCSYCYYTPTGVLLYQGAASGELAKLGQIDTDAVGATVYTGFLLAGLDDQDGDDLAELVSVSATDYSKYSTLISASAHTALILSPGQAIDGATSTTVLQTWTLPDFVDGLSQVDDMDGDGVDEAALSVDGALYLVPADASTGTIADLASAALTPSDCAPTRLAELGDLDGDGLAELAFAAQDWSNGADTVGAVFLVPGGTSGASDGSGLERVEGADGDAIVGDHVALAGDVDGDGEADLIASGERAGEAGVWLWLGPLSSADTSTAWRFFGAEGAVSALPDRAIDADGDGLDDVAFAEVHDLEFPREGELYPGVWVGNADAALRLFLAD